jgi:Domain of unknown function (DUF6468)
VSHSFGLVIEGLVALLLLLTIGYCVILNSRLKRLKADEQALKATISELITATEIAGRAVAGLKATAQDCDLTLGERMRAAERLSADMDRQIRAGEAVGSRLAMFGIAPLAPAPPPMPAAAAPPPPAAERGPPAAGSPDPKAVAAAAQAFAERARGRAQSLAA